MAAIGHVTMDRISLPSSMSVRVPGGPALYFGLTCAYLGLRTVIIGKIGKDFAKAIVDFLSTTPLSREGLVVTSKPTTSIRIKYGPRFSRELDVKRGASYDLLPTEISDVYLSSRVIHLAALPQRFLVDLFSRISTQHTRVAYDPEQEVSRREFDAFRSSLDFVHCDRKMARRLLGRSINGNSHSIGKAVFLITSKNSGALVLAREHSYSVPPPRIAKVADPTGAGDTAFAGFISSYLRNKNLLRAARVALAAGSFKVAHVGPCMRPSWRSIDSYVMNYR